MSEQKQTTRESEPKQTMWEGDALGRRATGDFLYALVLQKHAAYHSKPGSGALCFALDADWGAGKSFFIDRWSRDVAGHDHPVIHFDAWLNDLADDPLLGFMAQLRAELAPWIKRLPIAAKVKGQASTKLRKVMRSASRAVLPVAAVLGKAALTKVIPVDLGDLSEAFSGDGDAGGGKALAGEALDKFFEEAMKSHTLKQDSIRELKTSMEELLIFLDEQEDVRLPLFIFVDELDRCRPDYAIKLLEGVKHLFDAYGLCFVFSTNLTQLAASAKAVYGEGFDAERYLKRFFSFQFLLPEPDHVAYANVLFDGSIFEKKRFAAIGSALPEGVAGSPRDVLVKNFALVSRAFALDLRSQKQVFQQAEAVAAALDPSNHLHCFYLFFLVAVLHRGTRVYDDFVAHFSPEKLKPLGLADVRIPYTTRDHDGRPEKHSESLATMFGRYHSAAKKPLATLIQERRSEHTVYPNSVLLSLWDEGQQGVTGKLPAMSQYVRLVRTAGQIE